MKFKKEMAGIQIVLMMVSFFAFAFILSPTTIVTAATTTSAPSFCCEKTNSGAWCVNAPKSECNNNYNAAPTSCETTSYCRLGTCYESKEGVCMENTPQKVCNDNGGTWDSRKMNEVPQCQLGCCIIADQAAFVSLVRCKKLSTLFGVKNNYKTSITSEIDCIAKAQSQDKGACVYEKGAERLCKFTTREDCGAEERVEATNQTNQTGIAQPSQKTFYKNVLCSSEKLGTSCARQTSTTCHDGKVYWVDSCGNRENVYSNNKAKSWNNGRVQKADAICPANGGSNPNCGNCDYMLGTRCAKYTGIIGGPSNGDNYCKRTDCVDSNGKKRMNGESWCIHDRNSGDGKDLVGSRYFREVCRDGKVNVEPCADFRNEVCVQGAIKTSSGDFSTAACRVNRWQDCVQQDSERDCSNIDKRDCIWINSVTGMKVSKQQTATSNFNSKPGTTEFKNPTATNGATGMAIGNITTTPSGTYDENITTISNDGLHVCVPNFPPGLKFWEQSSAKQICGQANANCTIVYEKGLLTGKKIIKGADCLKEKWALNANKVCVALGDCGGYMNYEGQYQDDGYKWTVKGKNQKFSPNNVNIIKGGITGMVTAAVQPFYNDKLVKSLLDKNFEVSDFTKTLPTLPTNTPTSTTSENMVSKFFKLNAGGAPDALVTGLQWAAGAYMAGQMLGGMLGLTDNNKQALSNSMAAGFGTYEALSTYKFAAGSKFAYLNTYSSYIGLGIGVIIFVLTYKNTETKVVTFNCMPWQAPIGGNNCEKCNTKNIPCSEYRCKSLGQNCAIVNKGTSDEKCVNVNPREVNPPIIRPDPKALTAGHKYTNVKISPPGPGFNIINTQSSNGCLKAFTPLKFGITTNEPAQCKIDFNHTQKYDDMITYFGGSNLYLYNHTEQFSLPGASALANSSLILKNGKDMTFYIRCKNKNGNTNEAEYAVNFCIDPTPDTTPPEIEATSVTNGGCVAEGQDKATVKFYTNEPADCKWSTQDQDYDNMPNAMACSNNIYQLNAAQLFPCTAELNGISRQTTKFYVRCRDQPKAKKNDRNTNKQSFVFSLRGSTGLKLKNIQPTGTIVGSVSPFPIKLTAQTLFGCNKGQAICEYSPTGNTGSYIQFFDTDKKDGIHTQQLNLAAGTHKYFVKCVDAGGNLVKDSVTFNLDIDNNPPAIARIYEEDQMLKIITTKKSECSYTFNNCDFSFDEGTLMPYANSTTHVADWKNDKTYFIKCRDEFKNENAGCSAIIRPTQNFLTGN